MFHRKFDATDKHQPLLSERHLIEGSQISTSSVISLYIIQADGVNGHRG